MSNNKRIYTDEERKERATLSKRKYQARKMLDPEYRAKRAAQTRARYAKNKMDPTYVAKVNARNLLTYYEKIKPFPDKMSKQRARVKKYQKKRRLRFAEKKEQLQKYLGGKCVSCGITDPRLLDFDHINPETKTMMISQQIHRPIEELIEEVKKCQLLCPNCHRIKTMEAGNFDAYRNREYRNQFRTPFKPLNI